MPIVAVALLLLNDHVLKAAYPSWWTGKLSDVAGLAFFPLMLQAGWEAVRSALLPRRPWGPEPRVLLIAVALTGAVFAAIQLVPAADAAFRRGLGLLQAPFRGRIVTVQHTMDPTDLIALPALGLAWLGGRRRGPEPGGREDTSGTVQP